MKECCRTGFVVILLTITIGLSAQSRYYERVEETIEVSQVEPLDVVLIVDAGEVYVEKNKESDTDVNLYMKYSDREFDGKYRYDKDKNQLKIQLRLRNLKIRKNDNVLAEVELRLPADVDVLLYSKLKAGEMEMDMSGIRLKEFSLYNFAGDVNVWFDEPNPCEIEYLNIETKVGELRVEQLGNARFHKADINGGIGEMDIDFEGDLVPESMAKVDLDIGEASILLPADKGIKMSVGGGWSFLSQKNISGSFYKEGGTYYSRDFEREEEKFYLRVTPGLGELTIDR